MTAGLPGAGLEVELNVWDFIVLVLPSGNVLRGEHVEVEGSDEMQFEKMHGHDAIVAIVRRLTPATVVTGIVLPALQRYKGTLLWRP